MNCHLNQRSLLVLALLLGSDYDSQGIQGIGREYALKFLQSIPNNTNPIDYLRTLLSQNHPQNKYEQKICNTFKDHHEDLTHFEKIIKEYSSSESDNLPLVISIASIKWLKPVRVKQLQAYMKKKLGWMDSYTFTKVKFIDEPLCLEKTIFLQGFSTFDPFSNSLSIEYVGIGCE